MHLPKNFRGFTLIELLVAISIVAVMATIGLTVFSQAQKTARDSKRQADIREIQKALEQYYASTLSKYPDQNQNIYDSSGINNASYFVNVNTPKDPKGTNYSYYKCATAGVEKYLLCATLENNKNGNYGGDITDGCAAVPATPTADGSGNIPYYCATSLQSK